MKIPKFRNGDIVKIYRLPKNSTIELLWKDGDSGKRWMEFSVIPNLNKKKFIFRTSNIAFDEFGIYYYLKDEKDDQICIPEYLLKLVKKYKKQYWKKVVSWKI